MSLLKKPEKESIEESQLEVVDIKTEIAIAKFEELPLLKTRRISKKRTDEKVPA